jgi:hypothetical protein
MRHHPPTASVKTRAKRYLFGYVGGVYHCPKCDFAGHFFTVGVGPCRTCGQKIHQKIARWSRLKKRWIFKKRQQERGPMKEHKRREEGFRPMPFDDKSV